MQEAILTNLVNIIGAVVIALIGVAGTWLTIIVSKRTELTNINNALAQAQNIAIQTVGELQQTIVDDLKASKQDGKLTEDEIAMLRAKLLDLAKAKLSDTATDVLNAAGVDISAFIMGAAEEIIGKIKYM